MGEADHGRSNRFRGGFGNCHIFARQRQRCPGNTGDGIGRAHRHAIARRAVEREAIADRIAGGEPTAAAAHDRAEPGEGNIFRRRARRFGLNSIAGRQRQRGAGDCGDLIGCGIGVAIQRRAVHHNLVPHRIAGGEPAAAINAGDGIGREINRRGLGGRCHRNRLRRRGRTDRGNRFAAGQRQRGAIRTNRIDVIRRRHRTAIGRRAADDNGRANREAIGRPTAAIGAHNGTGNTRIHVRGGEISHR